MRKDSQILHEEPLWNELKADEEAINQENSVKKKTQASNGVKSTRNIILRR